MTRRLLTLLPAALLFIQCAGSVEPQPAAEAAVESAATAEAMASSEPVATAEATAAPETRTLVGEYHWADRTSGALEAIFTPTGEDAWDVSFHFEFRDEPHTYTGSAVGNLIDGELSGRVQNENRRRTWTFSGSFDENGRFHGDHVEIREGGERPTGTLWLDS